MGLDAELQGVRRALADPAVASDLLLPDGDVGARCVVHLDGEVEQPHPRREEVGELNHLEPVGAYHRAPRAAQVQAPHRTDLVHRQQCVDLGVVVVPDVLVGSGGVGAGVPVDQHVAAGVQQLELGHVVDPSPHGEPGVR